MLLKLLKLNWIYDLVHQYIILLKFKLKINSETYLSFKVSISHRVELSFYSKRKCQRLKSLKLISNLSHLIRLATHQFETHINGFLVSESPNVDPNHAFLSCIEAKDNHFSV